MGTAGKVACVIAVLALAGGAGKKVSDPNQVYGPAQLGDDVGAGVDRVAGGVGDAAGGSIGKSKVLQGAGIGAGAYGAAKAGKAWRNRSKDDPNHVDVAPTEPTLPPVQPIPGVTG